MRALRRGAVAAGASILALTTAPAATAADANPDGAGVQSWWYNAMNVEEVHQEATGEGVVVAVVDSHVNPDVPDLQGADVTIRPGCEGTRTPVLTDSRADHGTAMTTLIAGQGQGNAAEGRGVVGVAPDAEVRFYSLETDPDNDEVDCDEFETGKMIVRAARDGADVINLSFDGYTSLIDPYVKRAIRMGAVVVAAAGERDSEYDTMRYPATVRGVVAVLAADSDGKPWKDNPGILDWEASARKSRGIGDPTLLAPGVNTLAGGYRAGTSEWVSGGSRTGTSGAAALTSGAFAVLKSRYPEATGNQLVQAMIHHVEDGEVQPLTWDEQVGYGLLNLQNAMLLDPRGYPDVNPLQEETPMASVERFSDVYDEARATETGAAEGEDASSEESAADPETADTGTTDEPAGDDEATQGPPMGALLAGGGIALVVLGAAAVAARRRRHADEAALRSSATGTQTPQPGHRDEGER
ncbi:S8 family peptidase [Nocardioides aequoreus]|uniref:S8 family peptidase n=1 Tax=Nocardioides aequoreus TaxID=397278 RepID=UPI0004C44C7F|nr:S8 family serine peptidase [Nocardioides aequoreus]